MARTEVTEEHPQITAIYLGHVNFVLVLDLLPPTWYFYLVVHILCIAPVHQVANDCQRFVMSRINLSYEYNFKMRDR
jgi:hypothetical protein